MLSVALVAGYDLRRQRAELTRSREETGDATPCPDALVFASRDPEGEHSGAEIEEDPGRIHGLPRRIYPFEASFPTWTYRSVAGSQAWVIGASSRKGSPRPATEVVPASPEAGLPKRLHRRAAKRCSLGEANQESHHERL